MDAAVQCTTCDQDSELEVSPRLQRARVRERAEKLGFWWHSRRQVAQQLGVPDSSFRHWLQRHRQLCQTSRFPRDVVELCESPDGLKFLHGLLVTLHFVFVQANDAGLRNVGTFLKLSGLDEFLPTSYGFHQAFALQMETLLTEYGREEEQRLAAQMPPRQITVCEDETFHPHICLVAIEPVSGYLLLEQYVPRRDAETWNRCLDERLAGWSITVCQATSDQGSAERSPMIATWLREELLPGLYLERVAAKASTAQERERLRTLAREVLARARSPDGVWGALTGPEQVLVEGKARDCADLFQRSSSCVEGRNGQLSLRHHGLHRLTPRKLSALRVLHNFLIERADKTTAAERFFAARPRPLLPWLLARLPLSAHPRHRALAP